MSNKKI